jgi:hypothetical protein
MRNALLVLATFLATPCLQDYDLVVGASPVVVLTDAAHAEEPKREARTAAFLVLALPLVSPVLAQATGQAFGSLFLTAPRRSVSALP